MAVECPECGGSGWVISNFDEDEICTCGGEAEEENG